MTYTEYKNHIKICQYLGKEPEGEYKELYTYVENLWKDMKITIIDEHGPRRIIFHKGTDFYMEHDCENGWMWYHHDRTQKFLVQLYKIQHISDEQIISHFIKSMINDYLNCDLSTTLDVIVAERTLIENYLNLYQNYDTQLFLPTIL
jgi:hypothetical protein